MSELFTHSPFAQTNPDAPAPSEGGGDRPLIPPPPQETGIEVTIRTMSSDLELMAKSGVQAAREVMTIGAAPPPAKQASFDIPPRILWGIAGFIGIFALFLLGYFVLPAFVPEETKPLPAQNGGTPGLPTSTAPQVVQHVTYFNRPADERLALRLTGIGGETRDGFIDQISALARSAKPGAQFLEVDLTDASGNALTWQRLTGILRIESVPAEFWERRFENDVTVFVYRDDKGSLWPGYVLKMKDTQSPLLVQTALLQLEAVPGGLPSFFFVPPGSAESEFRDVQISGQPMRRLAFSGGPVFAYGIVFNRYLILSASESGFKMALDRF